MTMTAQPDPEAEWWTTKDVAAYLGIEPGAVSTYRKRGQMPAPDRTIGSRTHLWKPEQDNQLAGVTASRWCRRSAARRRQVAGTEP
ncbi:hypothetical protein AB0D32_24000 [Micromonospora sp. NPDC048170]|uniref:hypothetical protein n=1 Tax=Micromonospora sp. NPDC048170 TaxID=3154819 RepID=UPI0033FB80A9